MGQINNGIASITMGAIAADGGMGTTLASLGFTEEDSVKFNFEDAEKKEYFAEEVDSAFFTSTKAGKKTIEFTIANPDVDTLVAVFGGSKTGTGPAAVYNDPAVVPIIEQSLKITPKVGLGFNFPRVLVTAKLTDAMGRNALLGVSVSCSVLQPKKAGVASFSTFNV